MVGTFTSPLRKTVLLVLTVSLLSGAAAAAVTVTALNPNPITPGSGTLSASTDLTIDSTSLSYVGNNVTAVDVTISNSGSSAATMDIHVALLTSTDSAVDTQTLAGKSVASSSSSTFSVSMSSTPGVDEFTEVAVTVEKTG